MKDDRISEQELRGLSVIERLVVCGLIGKWSDAVNERNIEAMISVLVEVSFTERHAKYAVDAVLQNPKAYKLGISNSGHELRRMNISGARNSNFLAGAERL